MDRQSASDQPVIRQDVVVQATPARVWPLLIQDSRATEYGFGVGSRQPATSVHQSSNDSQQPGPWSPAANSCATTPTVSLPSPSLHPTTPATSRV